MTKSRTFSVSREEKNLNLKERAQTCLLAHSFAGFLPVTQFLLVRAKVACLATIIPLAKSPLMGQLAVVPAAWAHSVICDYRGQSDVAGDGGCRFTPVENYTSAGLKGLTHLHTHTHTLMYHSQASYKLMHTHASSTNTHMHTHLQSKACGEFHWTQGAVEFHHTCQGFHAKLPFNGILNGRNLAQCFLPALYQISPVWYHIDHYTPNNSQRFCGRTDWETERSRSDILHEVDSGAFSQVLSVMDSGYSWVQ